MTNSTIKTQDVALDLQGLVSGTLVLSAEGSLPVEYLTAGDRLVTRSGLRILRAVSVRVVRRASMVRIGRDMLGVGRPEADVMVPAGQPVMIRDWRAQVLRGRKTALIAAACLVDGQLIRAESKNNVRLFGLRFDGPEVIYAGGLELACTEQPVLT